MKTTVTMIFGKIKCMKKALIMGLFCIVTMQTFGQSKDANTVFAQAEEQFTAKNYNDALSKLALYENLSNASKEKAQVLKIQIYRELSLKDKLQVNNYNNAVEELEKMYADGKKVNAEDLFRILKEQQEFDKDASNRSLCPCDIFCHHWRKGNNGCLLEGKNGSESHH